jgi:hypothetical protein
LYQPVALPGPINDCTFEISRRDPAVQVQEFTFG